jgi:hypothetical protein
VDCTCGACFGTTAAGAGSGFFATTGGSTGFGTGCGSSFGFGSGTIAGVRNSAITGGGTFSFGVGG